jgi:hypothetical protein
MVEVLLEPALKADPAWYVQLTITPSGQDELQLEAHVVSEHLVLDSTRLQAVAEPVDAVGGRVQIVSHDGAHALLRGIVPRAASEPQR